MIFIIKLVKNILKVAIFIVGLFVVLKMAMKKLEKMGVIKTEWIAQKTPSGKGIRYAMSVLDKVIISFQI